MIKIVVIMIIIISLVIIYSICKNENNETEITFTIRDNYTKNNIDIIKENEKKIKKLNKQLKNIKNK